MLQETLYVPLLRTPGSLEGALETLRKLVFAFIMQAFPVYRYRGTPLLPTRVEPLLS